MGRAATRVLMTADAVGGIWTYALDLSAALARHGVACTLAVLGPGLDAARLAEAAAADVEAIDLGHAPEWLAAGPDAVARGGAALAALAQDRGADLLQCNHPAFGAATTFPCPVLAVGHSCVATWWDAVRGTPLPAEFAWQADLIGRGYVAADAVAVPSAAFAAATAARYRLPRRPVVLWNGRAAAEPFRATPPVRAAVTAGRLWDEGKDVATLDRAAALTDVPVRAIGPHRGPNGASLATTHLQAVGSLPAAALREVFATRPVFLSAARYEPFGLAVLEAAQAGCALVLSDIPTFRELWDGAATFVPPGDAAGFAAELDGLVGDPDRRERLGEAARERAARYTLDAAANGVARLYQALLAERAGLDGRAA